MLRCCKVGFVYWELDLCLTNNIFEFTNISCLIEKGDLVRSNRKASSSCKKIDRYAVQSHMTEQVLHSPLASRWKATRYIPHFPVSFIDYRATSVFLVRLPHYESQHHLTLCCRFRLHTSKLWYYYCMQHVRHPAPSSISGRTNAFESRSIRG